MDQSWHEVRYHEKFAPSKGPMSAKSGEWLENNQYVFTFDNPEVKTVQVNVHIEQVDIRIPGQDQEMAPPFNKKRSKVGFCVLEMSKA